MRRAPDHRLHDRWRQMARELVLRRGRGDVGVKPAGRCGDQIHRDRTALARIGGLQRGNALLDRAAQRRIGRTQIGARGRIGVVRVGRGGDGRLQKYRGPVEVWPMSRDSSTLPSRTKLVGFGLAASSPVMPGVLIAVGAAGAPLVIDCANTLLAGSKTRASAAVRCFWRNAEETVSIAEFLLRCLQAPKPDGTRPMRVLGAGALQCGSARAPPQAVDYRCSARFHHGSNIHDEIAFGAGPA